MGTPFCVTVNDDTLEKGTVTIRSRDTAVQVMQKTWAMISEILGGLQIMQTAEIAKIILEVIDFGHCQRSLCRLHCNNKSVCEILTVCFFRVSLDIADSDKFYGYCS